MKTLITGVAGTGKSAISKLLKEQGILSADFSEVPGMCFWRNKQTKEKIEYSLTDQDNFFDLAERICDVNILERFLSQHENIVMCGIARGNQVEYLDFFDKVLLLQCSLETITQRLQTRTAPFGKTQAERDYVVDWQKQFDSTLLAYGAIPINTEGEIDTVINKVIENL